MWVLQPAAGRGFGACYSFSLMGAATADARFGSDDRLLIGCIIGSLVAHALTILYVPRMLPHGEPVPPLVATIREIGPPPLMPKSEPPSATSAPNMPSAPPTSNAPREVPSAPRSEPATVPRAAPKAQTPVQPEVLTAPPQPASAERASAAAAAAPSAALAPPSAAPALPSAAVAPPSAAVAPPSAAAAPPSAAAAPPSAAPALPSAAPAPPSADARKEADTSRQASVVQAPGVPDGSIACQYRNTLLTLIGTRRLLRYPQEARDNGWVGNTVVILMIGVDGKVAGIRTATSTGHDVLDEQARIAAARAKQLAAVPPQLLGRAFELRLTLGFSLDDNPATDPVRMRLQSC
jgi:TonB family protein